MRFKSALFAPLFIFFILSCKDNKPQVPDYSFYANVKVNDEHFEFGFIIDPDIDDSLLYIELERVTDDGRNWEINFSPFTRVSQDIILKKNGPGNSPTALYSGACCVPPFAPFPDLLEYVYAVWDGDSLNNLMHVEVDTSTHRLTGNITITFVNDDPPFDTLRMSCEEFACYWE